MYNPITILTENSQVHELHPSHAFLTVPDRPVRSHSEPDFIPNPLPDQNDEQCW